MPIQKPWYLEAIQPLKKYADFKGRASRREYWYFYLLNLLIGFFCGIIINLIQVIVLLHQDSVPVLLPLFGFVPFLIFLIPNIAVAVRRLHDTGRSGWNYFLLLIPLVGPIILLVFFASDGQPGTNQYGPNPKESA